MKISVLYYSKSGNTEKMAQEIVNGAMEVDGVEAKAFSIDSVDEKFLEESKCIIIGAPIYVAGIAYELEVWLQTSPLRKYFTGKLGGAFATANYVHGGGDLGVRTILDRMLTLGMVTYSGGGSFGTPVIHLGPVAIGGTLDDYKETFKIYGNRMATKTKELYK